MTPQAYERWKEFAVRMAQRGLGLRLKKSRDFVEECVLDFFGILDDELQCGDRLGAPHDGLLTRINGWDETDSHPTWRDPYNHISNGPYICDMVRAREDAWNPYYWRENWQSERWDDHWGSRIRCCLRSGLDMAIGGAVGVIGFTAGDLRRMYPEGVPEWITGGDESWVMAQSREPVGTFAELSDDAEVIL
jgi:hypothetical protein